MPRRRRYIPAWQAVLVCALIVGVVVALAFCVPIGAEYL